MGFRNFINGSIRLSYAKAFLLATTIAFVSFLLTTLYKQSVDGKCHKEKYQVNFTACDLVGEKGSIVKTLQFMLKDVEADDSELIDFVRTLIKPPSNLPINLNDNRKDHSQFGQSLTMDTALGSKRDGFFIEAGAYNGEWYSNTLFFELERNWTGLLIEPMTGLYDAIVKKNRNVYSINACIADNKPFVGRLRMADILSGREEAMGQAHKNWINEREKTNSTTGSYINIPCFSLYTILKAINVDKVDYFSLDIEGGEWDVIKSLPYNKIDFQSLTVEHSANPDTSSLTKSKLLENGFKLYKEDGLDLFMVKNKVM